MSGVKNGEIRATANRKGKLYAIFFRQIENITNVNVNRSNESQKVSKSSETEGLQNVAKCKVVETLSMWHCKLAHQNFNHVKEFLQRNYVKYLENDNSCGDCIVGKQRRTSFPIINSRGSKTCELIHADVCGPFETTSLVGAGFFYC